MKLSDIKTSEQLYEYLRNWTSFEDDEVYYYLVGVIRMMLACMDNIKANAFPEDIEDIGECFTKEQREFFILIADVLKNKSWDDD